MKRIDMNKEFGPDPAYDYLPIELSFLCGARGFASKQPPRKARNQNFHRILYAALGDPGNYPPGCDPMFYKTLDAADDVVSMKPRGFKPSRRRLSPITIERRVKALIEFEQVLDRPTVSRPGASAIEQEIDILESMLHRRQLAIDGGLMNRRKGAAMWQAMERRLAQLRKLAPAVVQ